MAVKSAYREKLAAETPAPNIPEEKIQPSESVHIDFATDKAEPSVGIVSADDFPEPDEATLALQKQLADLKKSEQMQRDYAQRMAQMAAPAPTLPAEPEARIALWRTQGLTDDDASFLQAHLELAAEPQLTRVASDEAALHHERDTDAHRAATLEAFRRLQGQQAQAQPASTPAFFEPPDAARSPAAARPGSFVFRTSEPHSLAWGLSRAEPALSAPKPR